MADPPPEETAAETATTPISPTQAESLLSFFTTFLTLSIHSLLYHRHLYPATSFLTARAYNLPVQQSRHPGVCRWVKDAVAAVAAQVRRAHLGRVVFVVHDAADSFSVLEKWVFDVSSFPAWQQKQQQDDDRGMGDDNGSDFEGEETEQEGLELMGDEVMEMEGEADDSGEEEEEVENPDDDDDAEDEHEEEEQEDINWADVHESLRSALRKLSHVAEKLPPLPKGCTFTLAVELRDDAPAPVSHPLPWVASSSILQRSKKIKHRQRVKGKIPANKPDTMTPIRAVQAGPLFFECWAELAKSKPVIYKKPDKPAMRSKETATKKVGFDLSKSTSSSSSSRTVKPKS